ncbi:hypothetical protein SAMN04487835_1152 [Sharpea azabuensis]|uniref:hypothetical protein n=1 Tax=Sharpea azabuensis TaxID=322505 RepID=UPI0008E64B25|nr:hypothetical protein [Sharpea azabuensis]SFD95402.1 hypothetical protein SAMN04487836_11567 [Sharpea azabuensis]SFK88083.1 hypothetical protein SAMN04487835_1152 [Sharpea azabuensis]
MNTKDPLYISTMDKAKKLDHNKFEIYMTIQQYVLAHCEDSLKANMMLSHAIDELKEHNIAPSNLKTYYRHLEKDFPIKKEMKEELSRSQNNMSVSLIWCTMSSFIVLMFIKEVGMNHYMIHLYVDSAIAIIAFYIMLHQLHIELNILNMNKVTKRPLVVMVVAIVVGMIVNIVAGLSSRAIAKFDFSFLILVVGMFTSRSIFIKQTKGLSRNN